MPDNLADGTGQVPPASQSPDGNGQVPPTSQVSSTDGHGDDSTGLSPEQLKDALDKARKEAAKHRVDAKRLAELEARFQQEEDAKLSETDRLQKQYADLQAQAAEKERQSQERVIRADVRSAAKDLGVKPELAYRLIEYSAIEFNDDGDPTNVAELLAKAMADYGLPTPAQQQEQQQHQTPSTPAAPAMGATNPPRGSQVAGANGMFARDEVPKLTDPRLWKR